MNRFETRVAGTRVSVPDLVRIIELENAALLISYGYLGEVNIEFSYSIMQRTKGSRHSSPSSRPETSPGHRSTKPAPGGKPLDTNNFPFADEPIINTKDGPVPMSLWQIRRGDRFGSQIRRAYQLITGKVLTFINRGGNLCQFRQIPETPAHSVRLLDAVRYDGNGNANQRHYMTIVFTGVDGTTYAFTRSGVNGQFNIVPATIFNGSGYGNIGGRKKGESGYYRPTAKKKK